MYTPGPGNDHSLTADEARTWQAIERNLRLRARYRHRVAAVVLRFVRRPIVAIGLILVVAGLAIAGVALLPWQAALIGGLTLSGLGLLAVAAGVVLGFRRRGGRHLTTGGGQAT